MGNNTALFFVEISFEYGAGVRLAQGRVQCWDLVKRVLNFPRKVRNFLTDGAIISLRIRALLWQIYFVIQLNAGALIYKIM
jgi:hypothetical protein